MIGGWIKLHRSIQEHWIWQDPIKFKWWIDILISVNHESKKVNVGLSLIDCDRGQSVLSLSSWAKRWGVSKHAVNNFFTLLKKDNMITTENMIKTIRITVCNYDIYQDALYASGTDGEQSGNASGTDGETNKNEKNNKNEKKEEEYNKLYVGFISSFNSIKGSKFRSTDKVRKQFYARLREGFTVDQMLEALRNAMKVKYHIDNKFTYLTPEFFTRSDKIEMYSNQEEKPSQSSKMLDIIKGIQP